MEKLNNGHMGSKVFLGGTCNNSTWRDELMPYLQDLNVNYFNPVVEDWTADCIDIENDEKTNKCDIHLYAITSEMSGVYSIAEAIESVFNKNKKTIFHVITNGFDHAQIKSLKATASIVSKNKGVPLFDVDPQTLAAILEKF